jgi:hypothetical protein
VSRKPSASLSGIMEFCLFDERQNQIVDASHNFCKIVNRHAVTSYLLLSTKKYLNLAEIDGLKTGLENMI